MCNLLTVKIKPLSRIPYQRGRVGKRDRERERERERKREKEEEENWTLQENRRSKGKLKIFLEDTQGTCECRLHFLCLSR
jgi:hypothetical protein